MSDVADTLQATLDEANELSDLEDVVGVREALVSGQFRLESVQQTAFYWNPCRPERSTLPSDYPLKCGDAPRSTTCLEQVVRAIDTVNRKLADRAYRDCSEYIEEMRQLSRTLSSFAENG